MYDEAKVKKAVEDLIVAVGENPAREGLVDTPRRIAEMYKELLRGMETDPVSELKIGFQEGHREMVIARDIPFYSLCEHHFLPFFGVVHIGYIPNVDGRVVGVSKLARVVEGFARRPQLQERLTTQIAEALGEGLQPEGVAVVMQAEHLCMIMRGVKKPGSSIITSAVRGIFRRRPETRAEFFSLIRG
jgi:GTP cyclohydrolase IA